MARDEVSGPLDDAHGDVETLANRREARRYGGVRRARRREPRHGGMRHHSQCEVQRHVDAPVHGDREAAHDQRDSGRVCRCLARAPESRGEGERVAHGAERTHALGLVHPLVDARDLGHPVAPVAVLELHDLVMGPVEVVRDERDLLGQLIDGVADHSPGRSPSGTPAAAASVSSRLMRL